MRMPGLLGAAIALSVLTPIAPANASTISMGGLMYTDLFRWPNWREILAKYDCTTELNFYLTNAPSAPPPVVITAPPIFASVSTAPSGEVVETPDPIGTPGGAPPAAARRQSPAIRSARQGH